MFDDTVAYLRKMVIRNFSHENCVIRNVYFEGFKVSEPYVLMRCGIEIW